MPSAVAMKPKPLSVMRLIVPFVVVIDVSSGDNVVSS
jgi:hypothetical protein